jgi:hypothetical protein
MFGGPPTTVASPFTASCDAFELGGGIVVPARRGGMLMPVGGALRLPARRGGSGGNRRPHAWHAAIWSAFSALQNGQNRI